MELFMHFCALFMTSKGLVVTQHKQKKQQKMSLCEEYGLYLHPFKNY